MESQTNLSIAEILRGCSLKGCGPSAGWQLRVAQAGSAWRRRLLGCTKSGLKMSLVRYRSAVAKPNHIELPTGQLVPILYEDRSVIAIDKPPGWILAPASSRHSTPNLHTALVHSLQAGDFLARGRNLKFLRFLH